MTHRLRWNDLQIVLTVAEHGSASQAAVLLGVNHSTVIRRINDFELTHGVKLFERHPTGLKPTRAGLKLLEKSRSIESAVLTIEREILGQDRKLEGDVRITTTDSIADGLLAPLLAEFRTQHPAITLDVIITNARLDLPRLDADVAIRPSLNPPEDLIGRNVSAMAFTTYAATSRIAEWREMSPEQHVWIGLTHDLKNAPAAQRMQPMEAAGQIAARGTSFVTVRELAASGIGLAILPCFLGDVDQRLTRFEPPHADLETNVWVLTHKDLRELARVKALSNHLAKRLRQKRDVLEGRATTIDRDASGHDT